MTKSISSRFLWVLVLSLIIGSAALAQEKDPKPKLNSDSKQAREYSLEILSEMKEILEEHYYDPKFRGIDLDARIKAAKERVKTLQYNWQMYRVLVQVLMDFNDSHTGMILPPRSDFFQYGFGTQMIGDDCLVISVNKDSDAARQGLTVGDQVLLLGKFKPNRRDLWKINYLLFKLEPSKTLELKIRKPDGSEKSLTVTAKTMTMKEAMAERKAKKEKEKEKEKEKNNDLDKDEDFKCREISKEVMVCKLYSFIVESAVIDKMMKQVSTYPKFILDLRGNGGGYVTIEEYLLSHFFPRTVKIADMVTKVKTEKRFTKVMGKSQYKGEMIVLVDSNSASAAEITARTLQIEKRAVIYGDISSGSVMTSITLPFQSIMGALATYAIIRTGMSVTIGDVIMSDGSRLENTGVLPDEILRPTPIGLAKRADQVLAYAAEKFGVDLTPEKAGEMYFLRRKVDDDIGNEAEGDQ
jgi:C-terminal processing protease CtpA/Prc